MNRIGPLFKLLWKIVPAVAGLAFLIDIIAWLANAFESKIAPDASDIKADQLAEADCEERTGTNGRSP